jgi:hypothetical protein
MRVSTYDIYQTAQLYQRYESNPRLLTKNERRALINGLVRVIQDCNENAESPSRVKRLTRQFKKKE